MKPSVDLREKHKSHMMHSNRELLKIINRTQEIGAITMEKALDSYQLHARD
jgi:hypothetical protein